MVKKQKEKSCSNNPVELLKALFFKPRASFQRFFSVQKIVFAYIMIVVSIVLSLVIAVSAWMAGEKVLLFFDLALVVIMLLFGLLMRKTENSAFVLNFGSLLVGAYLILNAVLVSSGWSGLIWSLTYPLVVVFLLGKKRGFLLAVGYLVTFLLIYYLTGLEFSEYSARFFLMYIIGYLTMVVISLFFEQMREMREAALKRVNLQQRHSMEILKQNKNEIQSQHDRVHLIFELATSMMFTLDRTFRIKLVNREAERVLHTIRNQTAGRNFFEEFVPSSLQNEYRKELEKILSDGSPDKRGAPVSWVSRIRAVDGNLKLVSWQAVLLKKNVSEETTDILLSGEDITEQDRWQKALKESEAKYRKLVDNSMEGIYVLQQNKLRFCNNRMAEMFGYSSREEMLGMDIRELVASGSWKRVEEEIDARMAGEKNVSHYSFTARRRDGSEFEVETLGSYLIFAGEPAIHGAMRDMSRQKMLEKKLLQVQKLEIMGTLAGGIAHDLNNILQPIQGYVDLILEREKPQSQNLSMLEDISTSVNRAKELVRQILTFSRRLDVKRKPLYIQSVIQEAVSLLRSVISANIELVTRLNPTCGQVMADENQIHQVVMNLCTNAYQAIGEQPGRIEISLEKAVFEKGKEPPFLKENSAGYLVFKVCDNGCGMDNTTIEKVFDPFFTTKSEERGTGLGLSTSHGIVSAHGGGIDVESSPGQGTVFSIYLPVAESEGEASSDSMETEVAAESVRVVDQHLLIVDDEIMIGKMWCRFFEKLGYEVTVKNDSREALKVFRKNPDKFHLLITDLNMPGMGGDELARIVFEESPGFPVILLSGYVDDEIKARLVQMGVSRVLIKPLKSRELLDAIRQILIRK